MKTQRDYSHRRLLDTLGGTARSDAGVRAAGIAAGLVDNTIGAYSDSHTATRYVIPRSRRR